MCQCYGRSLAARRSAHIVQAWQACLCGTGAARTALPVLSQPVSTSSAGGVLLELAYAIICTACLGPVGPSMHTSVSRELLFGRPRADQRSDNELSFYTSLLCSRLGLQPWTAAAAGWAVRWGAIREPLTSYMLPSLRAHGRCKAHRVHSSCCY